MRLSRFIFIGAALVCMGVGLARVSEDSLQDPSKPPVAPGAHGPVIAPVSLLSDAAVTKLSFSDEQKSQYDQLDQAFRESNRKLLAAEAAVGYEADLEKLYEIFQAKMRLHMEGLMKVEQLLREEQKTTFQDVWLQWASTGARFGPPPGEPPFPYGVGRPFLSMSAQDRLQMTQEQRRKLRAWQRNLEINVLAMLTPEQKLLFAEMRGSSPTYSGFAPMVPAAPLAPPAQSKPQLQNESP